MLNLSLSKYPRRRARCTVPPGRSRAAVIGRIPVDGNDFSYCFGLLLFRNANSMDLLPSFVGPRGCSGVAFTVRGHYLGAGLHDLPGLETAEAEGVSVNSRIGACVESRIARREM